MRERGAYMQGRCPELADQNEYLRAKVRAALLYPLPKVMRTREVADPINREGLRWRVQEGVLECAMKSNYWAPYKAHAFTHDVTIARATLWADILTTPDELVEDTP